MTPNINLLFSLPQYITIYKQVLDTKGREVFHECMEQSMTAIQCKDFIDEEIWSEFTDEDRFIKSIIVSPRGKSSFSMQVFFGGVETTV